MVKSRRSPLPALRDESGFTLIELMASVLVMTTGLIALVGTFDGSRDLTSQGELKEAAAHRAQREVERLKAFDFDELAHASAPTAVGDSSDPRSRIAGTTQPTFAWDVKDGTKTEPLVTDAGGTVAAGPETWNDGRFSGKVWRFVTRAADPACSGSPSPCLSASSSYRRVTVVVSIQGLKNKVKPVWVSSLVSDPDDAPTDGLQDPFTECRDESGEITECQETLGDVANTWFLYDTPATSSTRQAIGGDHPLHRTVAPFGVCLALVTTGCPVPDLMGEDGPPGAEPLPPAYKYSNDVSGSYSAGRALVRDTACDSTPSASDNSKGAFWVTAPLAEAKELNGAGALSLYSKTIGGVSAQATLCLAVYDVDGSIPSQAASAPTRVGTVASHSPSTWPTTASNLTFRFDTLADGTYTVPAGHRVGVRVWATASSGADLNLLYDHPSYPSSVQLNEPGS